MEKDKKRNSFTVEQLAKIKDQIESMDHFNQVEILRILTNYKNVTINETKSGSLVILDYLNNDIVTKITAYIDYVNKQNTNLEPIEKIKNEIKYNYFREVGNNDTVKI